jgi:hypothetical protein
VSGFGEKFQIANNNVGACILVFGIMSGGRASPCMKLNGTVLNRRVIFRDNVPGIVVIRNLKSQVPNIKEIPNSNIQ